MGRGSAPGGRARSALDFDLRQLAETHREIVPQDEAGVVVVDRAAVDQHELRVAGDTGRCPRREVEVARRHLNAVEPGLSAQDVSVGVEGGTRQPFRTDDRDRSRCVGDRLLGIIGVQEGAIGENFGARSEIIDAIGDVVEHSWRESHFNDFARGVLLDE